MAGLSNFGSTCFMNSILQALRHCKDVPERIHFLAAHLKPRRHFKDEASLQVEYLQSLDEVFTEMKILEQQLSSSRRFLTPQQLLNSLQNLLPDFDFGKQQDAMEFLNHLLRLLEEMEYGNFYLFQGETTSIQDAPIIFSTRMFGEMNDQIPVDGMIKFHFKLNSDLGRHFQPSVSTDIRELKENRIRSRFTGCVAITIECLTCHLVTIENEEFLEMSIEPIEDSCLQVSELLQRNTHPYLKPDHNCMRCDARVTATASRHYTALPQFLVVHVQRFSLVSWGKFIKTFNPVKVDLQLECKEAGADGTQLRYELFVVVMHSGTSLEFGHNTTYIRANTSEQKGWMHYNDRHAIFVTQTEFEDVLQQKDYHTPYLFFYQRAD